MPWISNSYLPGAPCEKAAKHYPIPTLRKLNLHSEQGKGQGSKTYTHTHFDRLIGNLGPAFPSLLVLQPLLAIVLRTKPCALLVRTVWHVPEPAGSHCAIIAREQFVFLLKHLKKRKSFVFCPTLFFVSRQCHQFPKQRHPSPKWEVSADSIPGSQLLREIWLLPVGSSEQKDMGLGAFSSPGAAWGKMLCSPRPPVQRWMCMARAGTRWPPTAGPWSCLWTSLPLAESEDWGGSPVLPAPLLFLPQPGTILPQPGAILLQPGATLPQPGAILISLAAILLRLWGSFSSLVLFSPSGQAAHTSGDLAGWSL